LVTDWAPSPPAPVLAGGLLAGALAGPVVAGLELEPELELLLLQAAAASTAAAATAKPNLRCLSMAFSDPVASRNLDEPPWKNRR
jgi:hypothetical protein